MQITETWWAWREWLELNPEWVFFLIFGLAALEAVAVIGSIIPAIPMMIGLTLFAGHLGLDVWLVLGVAVVGAMLGDGISYAIGHHYKHRFDNVWPFRTHPHWLSASEAFVERHGGKSLIFGRFIGPIRAFVPMAAGIFQMPYRRFLWFNFISAVIWAPPNILPGYIAGAAVDHPLMPGKHQLVFISVVLITIASLVWMLPRVNSVTRAWRQRHAPHNAGLFLSADGNPENQFMTLLVGIVGFGGFALVASFLPLFKPWDLWVAQELMQLRQPSIDLVFTVFTLLADQRSLLTISALVSLWLICRREWRALAFMLGASLLCMTLPSALKWLFAVPRPTLVPHSITSFAFPSGHAFSVTVIWGLLYVLVTRPLMPGLKPWALALSLTLISFTAISRPLLGVHWMSDVLAGLGLGLGVLAGLRWAWYRGPGLSRVGNWEPSLVVLLALGISASVWLWRGWATALAHYSGQATGMLP